MPGTIWSKNILAVSQCKAWLDGSIRSGGRGKEEEEAIRSVITDKEGWERAEGVVGFREKR